MFQLFHTERKIISVSTWVYSLLLQVICTECLWNEVPVLGMGKRGAGAGEELPQEEQELWAACWRRKFSALTLAGQWPSRRCMQGLKQEEDIQSLGNAERKLPTPFNLYWPPHLLLRGSLIWHGGESAKRNSLVCWLWQLAAVRKSLFCPSPMLPGNSPGNSLPCGQLFLNARI